MTTKPAHDLTVGDLIDAGPYLHEYAPDTIDASASEYVFFEVEYVAHETNDCTVVGMGSDHYGVPSTYRFEVADR